MNESKDKQREKQSIVYKLVAIFVLIVLVISFGIIIINYYST